MTNSHLGDGLFHPEDAGADPSNSGGDSPARSLGPRHRLPGDAAPATRADARARSGGSHRSGGPGGRNPWVPLAGALALVLIAAVFAIKSLGLSLPSIGGGGGGGDFAGEGSGRVEVKVEQGDSGLAIGRTLEEAGVVKAASTFAQVFASDPDAALIQPGTYALRKEMSSAAALRLMEQPGSRTGLGVTIPEGLWTSEIYARLAKATNTPLDEYTKVKAADLGLPTGAKGRVEGYLFPSRYEFEPKATATEQLRLMVKTFKDQTRPLNIPADQLNRVMTVASFVQGEARNLDQDGPKVARVIENRLKANGETAGRLQMDSSIHFITQKRGTVTTTDRERNSSSPYNTYKVKGLPPGPINNPGLAAIKGARSPAPGPWIYFVTVNQETGETRFASTYAEHQRNLAAFRSWCQANPGKC